MKTSLLVAAVFLASPSVARSQGEPLLEAAGGAFFALSVSDMQASKQWYMEKLGLKVVMEIPHANKSSVTVLEGGGLTVELVKIDDARSLTAIAPDIQGGNLMVHGIFKAGLVIEDFDKTVATLRERGVTIAAGPFPAKDNQRANVLIRDNAGNYIQLFGN